MVEGIQEFLGVKGGVGVLVSLFDEDRTYTEIQERVDVTSSTLSKRLDEADDEGLVDIRRTHRHGRRTKEFYLTELGYQIALELSKQGVVSNFRKMMTLKEQVEEGTEVVIEAVADREVGIAMHPDTDQRTGREQFQEIRKARKSSNESTPNNPSPEQVDDDEEPEVSGSEDTDAESGSMKLDAWERAKDDSENSDKN